MNLSANMTGISTRREERKSSNIVLDEFSMVSQKNLDETGLFGNLLVDYCVIEESRRKPLHLHKVLWSGKNEPHSNVLEQNLKIPSECLSIKHIHTSICCQSQKHTKMTRWGMPHEKNTMASFRTFESTDPPLDGAHHFAR